MHATTAARTLVPNAILSLKGRNQLRQPLPVSFWQKCAPLIALLVVIDQGREVLRQKWQEYRRRARLEEKRTGKDPPRARFARRFHQSLKVARPVRDLRQHRRADHTRVHARKI